jgi:hypothetical protein
VNRGKLRQEAWAYYGPYGIAKCWCCGSKDHRTLHHVNDNGGEHRKMPGIGKDFYKWLGDYYVAHGCWPPECEPGGEYELQTLCQSCNSSTEDKHCKIHCTDPGHSHRGPRKPKPPGWGSWNSMKQRCTNPNNASWSSHGGRDITFCAGMEIWEGFRSVMGDPSEGMSIDRIDNDGGYWCGACDECKESGRVKNVQWATKSQQSKNRRCRADVQSRFAGVSVFRDRWQANICIAGNREYLGVYYTEEEAAWGRDEYIRANGIDQPVSDVKLHQWVTARRKARSKGHPVDGLTHCLWCDDKLPDCSRGGTPRKYCSKKCNNAHYRQKLKFRGQDDRLGRTTAPEG